MTDRGGPLNEKRWTSTGVVLTFPWKLRIAYIINFSRVVSVSLRDSLVIGFSHGAIGRGYRV